MARTQTGRARRGRLRDGMRTLVRQGLPDGRLFREPGNDLVTFRLGTNRYFLSRSPRHVEQVFIEGHDIWRKAVHYRLIATVTGSGLLTNEGPGWESQRRLIQPVFAKRHIDDLLPHMAAAASEFLDRFDPPAPPESFDMSAAMTEVTLDVVGRALFGAGLAKDADRLRPAVASGMSIALSAARLQMYLSIPGGLVDRGGSIVHRLPMPWPLSRVRRVMLTLDQIVSDIVDARAAEGTTSGSDLLDLLLNATDEDGQAMPRQQVRDELMTMMLAGHETTANALDWLWYLLAQHPEAYDRLRAEVAEHLGNQTPTSDIIERLVWTRACLQEAMRLYPPAWVLERRAAAATELDGYRIPKRATVIFPVHLIHRDPRWWDGPEEFRPERFLPGAPTPARGTYLPFGAGRRICVASTFALTEGTLITAMVTQRHTFSLPPGSNVIPHPTVTLRPRRGLPMLADPSPVATPSPSGS